LVLALYFGDTIEQVIVFTFNQQSTFFLCL
jgi:hypothetical protein